MYEMNAKEYNEKVMKGYFKKVYPVIASQILQRTGIMDGCCIDLGGGPGMLGISLAEITNLNVTIYDLLPECIELAFENIAGKNLVQRVTAMQGAAEDIRFSDSSVDLVISRGSVFFWENQEKGIREVYRVLKPGGWAYIGGGFGTREILAEVMEQRKDDPEWENGRKQRMSKNPPEHFRAILQQLAIPGVVESSEAGTWIIFQKELS
jgi:ubiquinone/menaquinone biosynthesis C-methylase UbiE